ncbi:MAG: GatB/YqeY domain-containing protein [Patescibacteria group bacterium]
MIQETIKNQIKDAMRAKDALKLEVLRGLTTLFTNELISKGGTTLSDEDAIALIRRSVKQRKDSIDQFTKGGRADLAEKEQQELAILEQYLPQMMSRDEIKAIAAPKIQELKAAGAIDKGAAGKIMGSLMKDLKGKADGADVKAVVEELIA